MRRPVKEEEIPGIKRKRKIERRIKMSKIHGKCVISLLWIMFVAMSCNVPNSKNDWNLILENKRIGRIMVTPDTEAVLISDSRDSHTLYYYPSSDLAQSPVVIILDVGVLKACITDRIWIVTDDHSLISYSLDDKSIKNYPDIDVFGNTSTCTVANDNSLLVWGKDWLASYNGYWEYESVKDKDMNIAYVVKDINAQIWLLTQQGDVFYLTHDKKWQSFGEVPVINNAHWMSITDQTLWLYVDNRLFKWNESDVAPEQIIVLSAKDYSLIGVQKDRHGSVWVLGYTGIWIIKDHRVERLPLPKNDFSIMHADFFLERDMIYAANLDGLFALDATQYSP